MYIIVIKVKKYYDNILDYVNKNQFYTLQR